MHTPTMTYFDLKCFGSESNVILATPINETVQMLYIAMEICFASVFFVTFAVLT